MKTTVFSTHTSMINIAETTIYNLDCFEKQTASGNQITAAD